jgi:hypothetical protein
MTIHATGETSSNRRKNRDSRPAAGVSVPAVAGACVPGLRIRSICCRKFSCTSAAVGASVPRPHATSPKPAAPAPVAARTHAEVCQFFAGLDLLEPGVVQVHRWRAEAGDLGNGRNLAIYAGVGRKP